MLVSVDLHYLISTKQNNDYNIHLPKRDYIWCRL